MASFTCKIEETGYTSAQLTAAFTGGTSDYSRNRYLRLTLDGRTQDLVDDDPYSPDYENSYWNREISPLSPGTTYVWSAVVVYVDGQGNRVETTYTASGRFTTPEQTYTLKLKITYDANGGSGAPAAATYTYPNETSSSAQKTVTLSSTVPTRSGYRFSGWLLNGAVYAAGASVRLTATTSTAQYTAVAQWTESGFFIWNGSEWKPATPYIWNGSAWKQAAPYVYNNGWKPQ